MTLIFSITEFRAVVEARKHLASNITRKIFVKIVEDIEKPGHYKNFKYYIMDYNRDADECSVRFGRIGANPQTHEYNIREGEKKELEKIRKGYKELTPAEYASGFAQYGNAQV